MPRIEFSLLKALATYVERGIWFGEVENFFFDPNHCTFPAKTVSNETRKITFARYKGEIWGAVWTRRGRALRVISVRRADPRGIRTYRQAQAHHGRRIRPEI